MSFFIRGGTPLYGYCKIFLFFISAYLSSFSTPALADDPKNFKKILIINSYHSGNVLSDMVQIGFINELKNKYSQAEIMVEYLDTKYSFENEYLHSIIKLLKAKYSTTKFSVIVPIENPALTFALQYRNELFPGVPIVFCNIFGYTPAMIAGHKNITGVAKVLDSKYTVEMMLNLHPDKKDIYLIHDYSEVGLLTKSEAEEQIRSLGAGIKLHYFENMTLDELSQQVSLLPLSSMILNLHYCIDKSGQVYDYRIAIKKLSENCRVPMYGVFLESLGYGVVGGSQCGGAFNGNEAALMTIKILKGKKVSDIPVILSDSPKVNFDYRYLEKFNIPLSSLPQGSKTIRLPESFYEKNKNLVLAIAGIFLFLIIIIIILSFNIIRRKKAESLLLKSEMKFRTIMEQIPEGIAIINNKGMLIYNSPSAYTIAGYKEGEIVFENPFLYIHPDDIPSTHEKFKLILDKPNETQMHQFRFKYSQGGYIWIEATGCNLINNQSINGIVVVSRNISERKSYEQKIEEQEKYYRALIEYAPVIIMVYSKGDLKSKYFSPAFQRMYGYNIDEYQDYSIDKYARMIHHDDRENAWYAFKSIISGNPGTTGSAVYRFKISDGSYRIIETFGCNYSDNENIGGSVFHSIDITERYLAEESLFREKERLSITLKSIGDGVITTDIDGKILLLNEIAESLTGWSNAEAAGLALMKVFRIINKETRSECSNLVKKVIQADNVIELDENVILISKTGKELLVSDSIALIKDRENKLIGTVLVFRDVTEKKRLETEILKKQKLESVGVLAGGIAHDFNNILTSITGNIQVARMKKASPKDVERLLLQAEKASLRAKNLTQQLLTFSKGGAPIIKTGSISEILIETTDFSLRGSSVTPEYSIPENIWMVKFDQGQISQVIQNIIFNAKESMPLGGKIIISAENYLLTSYSGIPLPEGKYVKIIIKDQGTGISKEYISKIFDPYFTTKEQGHGLGLAVCYSIIKNHFGYIQVDSEIDAGTTFSVFLPTGDDSTIEKPGKTKELKQGNGLILVMDDDDMVRDFSITMLQDLGYNVETAKDGNEVVELYKTKMESGIKHNVVILDLTIPGGMGGKETITKLKVIDPNVKAIVSSGYSNDTIIANYGKYGFLGSIVKPFNLEELSELIDKVIKSD